jgi:hypothetical protein
MRVRFLGIDNLNILKTKYLDFNFNQDFHFKKDEVYLVLSIRVSQNGAIIDCLNMYGHISFAPIDLFEVVDNNVSRYWRIKIWEDNEISFSPKEYYENEYFHDDLSEDIPEVVAKFHDLVKRMTEEQISNIDV